MNSDATSRRLSEASGLTVEALDGDGPPILLVHGFLMGNRQWDPNRDALQSFCRPILVQLLGHAGSPAPDNDAAYHPESYVDAFERLRAALAVESWCLCGYSLGGALTLRYALTHPERIDRHVFTNSTSALADDKLVATWKADAETSAGRIERGGHEAMARIPVHPRFARKLEPTLYQTLLAQAERHSPEGIAQTIRHTTPNASVRARLATNTVPALLINGTRERRFQRHAAFAEATMPQLTTARVEAGHGMTMEAPDAFAAALRSFL